MTVGAAPRVAEAAWFRGRRALVTGASAGIGAAYCRALAARGCDLIIVARRADRLHALRTRLEQEHGVEVQVVVADLAAPQALASIGAAIAERGLDVLVNNAGYGVPGSFLSSPWTRQAACLQVMVTAVAGLTHACLPLFIARGSGVVLNVASVAGFLPGSAGHTLYGATKAWMINFTESLACEYAAQGVRACAVCPGFTWTEFHDVTGTRAAVSSLPRFMWSTADAVVDDSFAAVARGRVVCIPGLFNRAVVAAARLLPAVLVRRLARVEGRRVRDAG
ncbi:MAG: SDR family oxidoreductase [Gammaproteobacteria bacterium]|nr:SDR family oxidoreductase [Gammaproteobacteria bacterium]MCP5199202.1 SDR family oxidoreductase [Gammaproteobacteria bacterium]